MKLKTKTIINNMIIYIGVLFIVSGLYMITAHNSLKKPHQCYDFAANLELDDVRGVMKGTDTIEYSLAPNSKATFSDSKGITRIFRVATSDELEKYWYRQEYSKKCIDKACFTGVVTYLPNYEDLPNDEKYQQWLKETHGIQ